MLRSGADLDVRARHTLWEVGLGYSHGTGHGIGYFLNVHEGDNSTSLNTLHIMKHIFMHSRTWSHHAWKLLEVNFV